MRKRGKVRRSAMNIKRVVDVVVVVVGLVVLLDSGDTLRQREEGRL